METWPFEFVELNYTNLHEYTALPLDMLVQYPLQQVSDIVRVHVLRDNGGVWLDADTIVLGDLPEETLLGYPETGDNTIGFLRADPGAEMFKEWATFQDNTMRRYGGGCWWSMFGNDFTDPYLEEHPEIQIGDITNRWPETYMIGGHGPRMAKYIELYFAATYSLDELRPTDLLMLHNSWTPEWYKALTRSEVLEARGTLSNILNEIHHHGRRQVSEVVDAAASN